MVRLEVRSTERRPAERTLALRGRLLVRRSLLGIPAGHLLRVVGWSDVGTELTDWAAGVLVLHLPWGRAAELSADRALANDRVGLQRFDTKDITADSKKQHGEGREAAHG